MAQTPPLVLDLVQRFDRNRDAYRSPLYGLTDAEIKIVEQAA